VAGVGGATAAALGIFLPVYQWVILFAPSYKRWAKNPQLNAFVRGVTAAATGAIAGAFVVLARRSVYDLPTIMICAVRLATLFAGDCRSRFRDLSFGFTVPMLVGAGRSRLIGLWSGQRSVCEEKRERHQRATRPGSPIHPINRIVPVALSRIATKNGRSMIISK
jgi:chromate transport protein ChrA